MKVEFFKGEDGVEMVRIESEPGNVVVRPATSADKPEPAPVEEPEDKPKKKGKW
jgi:hypothetical protein